MHLKICDNCGTEFEPWISTQRFCTRNCNRRYWDKKTGRVATKPKQTPAICRYCGVWFYTVNDSRKNRGLYCSPDCSNKALRKEKICVVCGADVKSGKYCSDVCKLENRTCEICGEQFEATVYLTRTICGSRECELEYTRIWSREHAIKKHIENAKPVECAECGVLFTPLYGSKRRVFCSDRCSRKKSKRIGKAIRRARKRGNGYESVDPLMILERDKWKCQNCGVRTPKILRGTIEDNAPEVDHIIPLAAGGNHVAYNLQCLCRKCNNIKGDSLEGQLLFAGVDSNA